MKDYAAFVASKSPHVLARGIATAETITLPPSLFDWQAQLVRWALGRGTALRMGRQFVGAELKPTYWKFACRNLIDATSQSDLFSLTS